MAVEAFKSAAVFALGVSEKGIPLYMPPVAETINDKFR